MIAFILAAGIGSRLKPLTDNIPKALVELDGKPMIDYVLHRLLASGVKDVVVNVHHHAGKLLNWLEVHAPKELNITISDEQGSLLDTGGAIKHAWKHLSVHDEVIVHNVDVISDIDLNALLSDHRKGKAAVTLAVRSRKSSRYLLFNDQGQLGGWTNTKSGEIIWSAQEMQDYQRFAFSGIHVLNPAELGHFPAEDRFSIIPFYLHLAARKKVKAYVHDQGHWQDLGRLDDVDDFNRFLNTTEGRKWLDQYLQG